MPDISTSLKGSKTNMEFELQKERWRTAAVRRRRARRGKDPDYRAQHAAQSRDYFRQKHGVDLSTFRDCRKNFNSLDDFGIKRTVSQQPVLTFTIREAAVVFGAYHPVIVKRWIKKGQLPAPIFETDDGLEVYVHNEIEAIIPILGAQQSQTKYFRADHTVAIAAIADAVEQVRQELIV